MHPMISEHSQRGSPRVTTGSRQGTALPLIPGTKGRGTCRTQPHHQQAEPAQWGPGQFLGQLVRPAGVRTSAPAHALTPDPRLSHLAKYRVKILLKGLARHLVKGPAELTGARGPALGECGRGEARGHRRLHWWSWRVPWRRQEQCLLIRGSPRVSGSNDMLLCHSVTASCQLGGLVNGWQANSSMALCLQYCPSDLDASKHLSTNYCLSSAMLSLHTVLAALRCVQFLWWAQTVYR